MLLVNLECADGHEFEGWYESHDDYYAHLRDSDISCPVCNSNEIQRKTSGFKPMSIVGKSITLTQKPVSDQVRNAVAKALEAIRRESFLGDEEGTPVFRIHISDLEKN